MFGFKGVHGVVIHSIELLLTKPVKEVDWQQLKQDVDEACVVLHVHWQAVVRNLADDPGTSASANINLQDDREREKQLKMYSDPKGIM